MKANEVNYDRPLTEEERVFSANLEKYDWLFKYMTQLSQRDNCPKCLSYQLKSL